MASTSSPLGTYYVKPAAGASPLIHFKAASLANAQTIGQSLATLLGRTLELYGDGVVESAPNVYSAADRSSGSVTVGAPDQVFGFDR